MKSFHNSAQLEGRDYPAFKPKGSILDNWQFFPYRMITLPFFHNLIHIDMRIDGKNEESVLKIIFFSHSNTLMKLK